MSFPATDISDMDNVTDQIRGLTIHRGRVEDRTRQMNSSLAEAINGVDKAEHPFLRCVRR